jgi:peptidoglycan hydrolase-like protein with peptidoglycan-binding domain
MVVWKQEDEFSRAEKVEKKAPTGKAKKTSRENLRPGTMKEVQGLLADLGYTPGPPDGIIGPLGRKAIQRYQAAAGLEVDGEVTQALLDSLREAQAAAAKSSPEKGNEEPPRSAQSIRTELGEDGVMREIDGDIESNAETRTGGAGPEKAPPEADTVLIAARPYFDNDQTAKEDALNVRAQATIFAKLIAAREVALPLSIGLFGNWGTGKTYFMNLIRDEIAALAAGEDPTDEKSSYMRRIAPIEFNAWHYVDTNLWASLAIQIFNGLAAQFARREGDTAADLRVRLRAEMESSTDAMTDAKKKQREAQKEREEAAVELEKTKILRRRQGKAFDIRRFRRLLRAETTRNTVAEIKTIAKQFGLSDAIETAEDAAKLAEQLRALNGRARGVMQAIAQQFATRRSSLIAGATIAALIITFMGIAALFPEPSVYFGQVIAALGGAVAWAGNRLAQIAKGVDLLDAVQASLATQKPDEGETPAEQRLREKIETSDARIHTAESQIAEADRRIAEAQAELQRINAGGLVYDFLEARGADPEYKKELGVISTIRRDFNGLKKLLKDWNKNYEVSSELPPIERIVLYIDDLDRCHPDKVVEVLQAVHLLLAFDLFVVIVAVDPRWLERSLYRAYVPELAERNLNGMEAQHLREFSPQNYLEKIFQIPFSLAAMSSDGYAKLINDLVVTRSEFEARGEMAAAGPVTGEAGRGGEGAQTDGSGGPAAETALARKPSSDEEVVFNDWEQAFLQTLHPFVPTPRLAKRMINIYRLIRVHALETPWRDTFFAPDGDYRAVLVLLALNIGHPRVGGPLLRLLSSGGAVLSLQDLLPDGDRDQALRLGYDEAAVQELVGVRKKMDRVDEDLGERRREHPDEIALARPDDIETYARWAPEVGRFSFHWNLE